VAKHVFGFTVTATSGIGTYVTNGFALDVHPPTSLDVSGAITLPGGGASVPVMSPIAMLVTMIGLGCAGAYEAKRRFQDWFGSNSGQA
jgi:hypothetical protein